MLSEAERLTRLQVPSGIVDVVIDSDTFNEIDDQFAISLALLSPERMRVQAIYAAPFHNAKSDGPADGMEKSYQEILRLLRLIGKHPPVYRGSDRYLPDERTPVPSDAASDLARRAMAYSKEKPLYVVGLAAVTNIASALLLRPEIAERIVCVWLGGHAPTWPDTFEFNLRQDVAAARAVFASGVPLVLVPCKGAVTTFLTTGPELRCWLWGKNALCDDLVRATERTAEAYAKGRVWSRVLWDVTAVAWLLNDDHRFMLDRLIPTPIPEYDHHWGRDDTRPLCRMVTFVNRDPLMEELFGKLSAVKDAPPDP